MRKKFITKHWTLLGYFFTFMWVWLLAVLFAISTPYVELVWVGIVLWVVGIGVAAYRHKQRLKQHSRAIGGFASDRQLQFDPVNIQGYVTQLGSIDDLHGAKEGTIANVVVGDDWTYCDFSYKLYGRTKYGDYRRAEVYYGVMSTELSRSVPHIFFDSIKARHRQFRFHFARSQRHDLEGDFSKYFVTYFPNGYAVDSLSIISPDVMWVMKEAADYDIEIYNKRVFLYGPIYDPAQQLPDMASKLKKIKKELMDNILTYRDERLPFTEGRQRVAATGASLQGSRFWKVVGLSGFFIYLVVFIYLRLMR